MQVDLVQLIQSVDLENEGEMTTSVMLRLPNGENIIIPLEDKQALAIIKCQRGDNGEQAPSNGADRTYALPVGYPVPGEDLGGEDTESAVVFGGDVPEMPGPAPAPPPPQPKPQQMRGRTVQQNQYGYPLVERRDGEADPGEVVGGGEERDEDGVGSI